MWLASARVVCDKKSENVGLAGAVIDSDDQPLSGAKVIVSEIGYTHTVATQHTDHEGKFRFTNLPPGKYTITASVSGHSALQGEAFWITRETLTVITVATIPKGKSLICQ